MEYLEITINGTVYAVADPNAQIDPEMEAILYADELINGMMVMSWKRASLSSPEHNSRDILKLNRWCTVTKHRNDVDSVTFVGVYEDKTQEVHEGYLNTAWVVKKDSYEGEEETTFHSGVGPLAGLKLPNLPSVKLPHQINEVLG